MEVLKLKGTNVSPEVKFDHIAMTFDISGYSRPENVRDFYLPILKWLEQFVVELSTNRPSISKPIAFNFRLIYFNSSSAKFIFDMITHINAIHAIKFPVMVNWYYDEDDEELKEAGEELSEMADFSFSYYEVKKAK
ncbi:DUF1987 domain-containing protein [Williamwhitmania taraxaci]|uniref:SiaC family regulatory phosphoprotein domain-containing protein n=1 Tax=Williamwhitmania taraxaci TaxID=1640674 RepID=A0A1G6MXX3_9BACT|nr:DUF1987 domain-containing protein [Williamwhitmania taraxaci]SDC59765.1 protein of unknown function [Williamwhitmania taraxaci]